MIIELHRLKDDNVLLTKYIKINATNMVRSYDMYRIDLQDITQAKEIIEAGFPIDRDHFFITIGQFIDLFHKAYENE